MRIAIKHKDRLRLNKKRVQSLFGVLLKVKCLFLIIFIYQWSWAEDQSWEKAFIKGNTNAARWFDGLAEKIDLFLTGRQLTNKKNHSKVSFENRTSSVEGQKVTNDFSVGVSLRLPNLEEYWQLKFASYDEPSEKKNAESYYLNKTPRKENYGASIGMYRKLGDIRMNFQPRIELKNPLSVSHFLTFSSTADMKEYIISPLLEFYAQAEKGTGVYWSLNFSYLLTEFLSLNLINNGDYVSQTHFESITNGVTLAKRLTDKIELAYGVMFFSLSRPVYYLDSYSVFTSFNQTIYKNILSYQLTPHLDFYKDQNFHGRAGISLAIKLDF